MLAWMGAVALIAAPAVGCIHNEGHDDNNSQSEPAEPICEGNLEQCDGECVDLASCLSHCGSCGIQCFSGQQCVDGSCIGVSALSPEELHEALQDKDFLLLNVRMPPVGIIPGTDGSVCNEDPEGLAEKIGPDLNRRVVVYCRTIPRSFEAIQSLRAKGYTSISYLDGGVQAWTEAGYELE